MSMYVFEVLAVPGGVGAVVCALASRPSLRRMLQCGEITDERLEELSKAVTIADDYIIELTPTMDPGASPAEYVTWNRLVKYREALTVTLRVATRKRGTSKRLSGAKFDAVRRVFDSVVVPPVSDDLLEVETVTQSFEWVRNQMRADFGILQLAINARSEAIAFVQAQASVGS